MRILIATNRHFLSGGPERYYFHVARALEARSHTVIPFALRYRDNEPTPYDRYFPKAPAGDDFVRYGDRPLGAFRRGRLAAAVIRNGEAIRAVENVIEREGVEVVYALQIAHYLFPEVMIAAASHGVPVLWRQSDFQLICPAYNSYRDGAPCHDCDRGLAPALRHRCLKGSLGVTSVRVAAMAAARWSWADRSARLILCPSRFLMERLRENGFGADRLRRLPTPVGNDWLAETPPSGLGDYFLYVGGVFEPKGVHIAVEAARRADRPLVVVGDAGNPYGEALVERARSAGGNVRFVGAQGDAALRRWYRGAAAVVVPSLWEENIPNVVLEAQVFGRPVIASGHGSLPEVVGHEQEGLLFSPGDVDALASAMRRVVERPAEAAAWGRAGRARVEAEHRMDDHIDRLLAAMREFAL